MWSELGSGASDSSVIPKTDASLGLQMEAEADVTVVESNGYFCGACYKIWEFRNGLMSWTVLRGN